MYLIGILLNLTLGFLIIRLLTAGRLNMVPQILLGLALGFGIDGSVTFYTHILFDQFNRWLPIGIVVLMAIYAVILNKNKVSSPMFSMQSSKAGIKQAKNLKKSKVKTPAETIGGDIKLPQAHALGLITLALLAIPLAISGYYYPLGGWDAWSCWSLKAKFIFLGQENWKDMLAPGLWRSNTHYPLLWPLINVWFFDLGGHFNQAVPMLNSIAIALLTGGLLIFGILELTGNLWCAVAAAVVVMAIPFNVTLFTSQYSDSLLGLFLLSAFMSLLLAEKLNLPKLKILSMVFLGLMGFTKNEGLMASGITALLFFWRERARKDELKILIAAYFIALLPTIVFTLFMAPKNEAFINGLASSDKPTTWARCVIILVYPWFESISGKWNGFWLIVLGGILLSAKKLWQSTLGLIAISIIIYLGAVMSYYAVNTFFEIGWWLQNTLSRILFALIPTIALWVSLGIMAA